MGTKDTKTKQYMEDVYHFADAFNYFLYDGRQVILPENLMAEDTTEIAVIWGRGSEEVIQKYRDVLKSCVIKWDGNFTYVFLGIENQSDIHYAMPVKNLIYDALNYGQQVDHLAKEHRRKRDVSGDEFLSGFSKTDKIRPVITLTIYFGADRWDAPRCLMDMMYPLPEEVRKYVNDYRLNLIVPSEIRDFSMFSTELKNVLEFIALSENKDALGALENDSSYEHLSVETVGLINECTSANFLIQEGEKEVNMCNGLRQLREEGREEGRENLIIQLLIKHSPKEVADFTGIPLEEILRIEQSKLTTV